MIKKVHLIAVIISVGIVISGYLLVTSRSESTEKMTASKAKSVPDVKQHDSQTSPTQTVAKATSTRPIDTSGNTTPVIRRGPPSKRIYTSAVPSEPKIAPASEYRKWSTKQWASKVNTLRANGENQLAQQYIDTYHRNYPDKSLDPYLE